MSYTKPHLSFEAAAKVSLALNKELDKIAREAYNGGYDDCLCDVVAWFQQSPPNSETADPDVMVKDLKKWLGK